MLWLHRGNRDAANDRVHVATWPERFTLQAVLNDCQRWVRKNLSIRQHTEQRNAMAGEPLLKEARQLWLQVKFNLVHDRPRDLNAACGKERCVQHDLVDRTTDTTFAHDDHRRAEERSNVGVAQANHRTDARMPRPLKQQQLVLLGKLNLGRDDLRAEILDHLPLDHLAREAARNLYGREEGNRIFQVKYAAHQRGIFVGWGVVDGDPALTNRLHEPRVEPLCAEGGEESERGGGLAAVLARGGEEELPCARGAGHQTTPRRAARCDAQSGRPPL